jgi:Legume lectin domain
VTPSDLPIIDFSHGFGTSYPGGELVLTTGPYQSFTFWNPARVDIRAFHTSFVFQQGDSASHGPIGDGFTFALSSSYAYAGGKAGGGLGFEGILDSVAIKFDLLDNAGEGSNSVGVYTGGAAPTTPSVNLDGTGIDLHGGHPFRADLEYDGIDLTLTLTDTTDTARTWSHDFAVDIPTALRASTAYAGFTAGTGELFVRQAIQSWVYFEGSPADGVNKPPAITTPPRVILETPTSIVLGGGAIDDGGAGNLTYNWMVVSTPAGASPQVTPIDSPDYPAAARVTLDRVGTYNFLLVARDAQGLITASAVGYVLAPKVTSLDVTPNAATLQAGDTIRFSAVPLDQFGGPMSLPGPVAWQVLSGPGIIDSAGLYTAPADETGTAVVRAVVPTSPPLVTDEATVRVVPATRPADGPLDFGDGFDGANLVQNGSAKLIGNRLRLADGRHQAGSAYAPHPVEIRGFTTSFTFRVGDSPFGQYGDGLTFVLQNAGSAALGAAGGGLGYAGIGQSVAVKFDLVDNAGEGSDSVGVFTNGATPTTPADTFETNYPFKLGIQFNSGDRFRATLSYSGGTLILDLTDLDTYARQFTKAYAVNIPAVVGGPTAFVGFTAGTGELFAPIDVLDWTYTPTVDASGDAAPIVVEGPVAAHNFVRGRSTQLSALGADDGGESNLTYTWRITGAPPGATPVRFSENGTNTARTTTATFDLTGFYLYQVVVTDARGHAVRSSEWALRVEQTPSAFIVTPAAPTVVNGGWDTIGVETLDQFGDPMAFGLGQWRLTHEGPGFIYAPSNQYIAPPAGAGPVTIRASNGTVTGTATILVVDRPPATGVQENRGSSLNPGLTVNGSAVNIYPWAQLTGDTANRAGSVFNSSRLDIRAFASRFVFGLGGPDYSRDPGTGIAFVIQGASARALGSAGSGFGYAGIDQSAAVAFDVAANAIGFATNGTAPVGTIPLAGAGIDLKSGHEFLADLYYDGQTLHISLTDLATGSTAAGSFAADLRALVGGDTAFVGFTASTGPSVNRFSRQYVASWRYQSATPGIANQPPVILRPARMVTPEYYGPVPLPLSVELRMRAEDDGGPFDLVYRRELISAPPGAEVQFDPVSTTAVEVDAPGLTSVRFSLPGTYVFRVTVADAQGLSSATEVTYVVPE